MNFRKLQKLKTTYIPLPSMHCENDCLSIFPIKNDIYAYIKQKESKRRLLKMKKLLAITLFLLAGIGLSACAMTQAADVNTFLSIEINPSMAMIVNQEENVVSYSLNNEAAEIVAAGLDLVGMNYEEALQLYLNAAVQTGYIDTERNDNAVAIQACSANDGDASQFQLQVETQLQTYFSENKLGAVVLNQSEVNQAVQDLAEANDISFGFAKLVQAYLDADEANTLEAALEMTPTELIDALGLVQVSTMAEYKNQRELGAQAIKDELAVALQSKVEAHNQAVLAGTCEQPDSTGVKEAYLNDYEGIKAEFVTRNQERVEYASAQANGQVSEFLVGTYSYENSSEELPYIVTYQNYVLNSDGTYTESHSWTSRTSSQTVTSEDSGTWEVVGGVLVMTNANEYVQNFEISGSRIIFEDQDGIQVTFRKMTSQN